MARHGRIPINNGGGLTTTKQPVSSEFEFFKELFNVSEVRLIVKPNSAKLFTATF